jgi:hypothetical protein
MGRPSEGVKGEGGREWGWGRGRRRREGVYKINSNSRNIVTESDTRGTFLLRIETEKSGARTN